MSKCHDSQLSVLKYMYSVIIVIIDLGAQFKENVKLSSHADDNMLEGIIKIIEQLIFTTIKHL